MEIREGDFSNSVASVAKDLLRFVGPKVDMPSIERRLYPCNHVKDYLPVLRKSLEEADRTRGNRDPSYPYFAVEGITELAKKRHGTVYSSEAVSWTVAFAILAKDPALAKTSKDNLRLLFDLSLGVAVDDFHARNEMALHAVAYAKSPRHQEEAQAWATDHQRRADYYKAFQAKLRQKISVSPASQRK